MRHNLLWETISYNFVSTLWYIGVAITFKLSIDWYDQKRLLQKAAVEKLQAEVNYLRSQVNPHFLFNALNNLYSLTLKKSDTAPDIVLKLSEMMEYMLYDSDDTAVTLDKEIQYLRNYIELEGLRYGSQADIRLNTEGDLSGLIIAPLLLLPLIENAFKHGTGRLVYRPWLHCDIQVQGQSLSVDIKNGKQTGARQHEKGGVGLANLKRRLELLYPSKHTLTISDNGNSFYVNLHILLS
jgi:LytS/YehU family sensor histidine kinase